jgi:hypothetical protein
MLAYPKRSSAKYPIKTAGTAINSTAISMLSNDFKIAKS